MTRFYSDFETYSEANLRKCGTDRYARDPSTEVLMYAYAFDNEPVQQWVPAEGEKMPKDVRDALRDPDVIKSAWNAPIEINILKHVLNEDIYINEWRCSMALAATLSLPLSLGKCGEVLGVEQDKRKDSRGKALIRKFCMPLKPTKRRKYTKATWVTDPDEWEEFKAYNIQDVEAERANVRKMLRYDLPEHEWELWFLDQKINQRGIPINLAAIDNAVAAVEHLSLIHI